ncbi:hypothetical protein [Marinobacter sp. AN1]|uniref:hypothetical protein n=1 Tax=Marinobacter sp. AN1 TaxID=2886046 RepID=UPI00222F5E0B|nr:hypothetical protein [Marinobacter sp. AN1]UZD66695.1 hypothetical protein LJ360_04930 [Marinobacter sp. AN1]
MDVLPLSVWLALKRIRATGTPEKLGRYSIPKAGGKSSFIPSADTGTRGYSALPQLLSPIGLDTLRGSDFQQATFWPALKLFATEEHALRQAQGERKDRQAQGEHKNLDVVFPRNPRNPRKDAKGKDETVASFSQSTDYFVFFRGFRGKRVIELPARPEPVEGPWIPWQTSIKRTQPTWPNTFIP